MNFSWMNSHKSLSTQLEIILRVPPIHLLHLGHLRVDTSKSLSKHSRHMRWLQRSLTGSFTMSRQIGQSKSSAVSWLKSRQGRGTSERRRPYSSEMNINSQLLTSCDLTRKNPQNSRFVNIIFDRTRLMAPSAPLGSAFGGGALEKFHENCQNIAFTWFRAKNWRKKISKFFFSIFPKFFSVEIFHMVCRLRIWSFMILVQPVLEISICGRTSGQISLV